MAANLNDGTYGNANSWIGASGVAEPWFAAVDLGGPLEITRIAWGRDNGNGAFDDSASGSDCCGGQVEDRSAGVYELQITTDDNPGPGSTWTTLATLDYKGSDDLIPGGDFTSHFRHEYEVSIEGGDPITATGVRVLVPATGIGGGTAIDEIEVYNGGVSKILGDMNGDGQVDPSDIDGFVQALVDPAGYATETGMDPVVNGDINGDGMLNVFDIELFVALLAGGAPVVQPMQLRKLRKLARLKLPPTDNDGDGQSNASELLSGTDPDDASDTFKITEVEVDERSLNLKWPTVPGKRYRVTATESLDKSWVPVEGIGIVNGDGRTVRAIVPLTVESKNLFYRVEMVGSAVVQ
jgi:hypothetical protein